MRTTPHFLLAALALTSLIMTGCTRTTLVLLPNGNRNIGHATIRTEAGSTRLNQPGETAFATNRRTAPQPVGTLSDEEIQQQFTDVLTAAPGAPKHYNLYFEPNSIILQRDAKRELRMAMLSIGYRKSCDIHIIGHTERTNITQTLYELIEAQSREIRDALIARGVESKCVKLHFYGENDPLIGNAPRIAHIRDRRIEIEVR